MTHKLATYCGVHECMNNLVQSGCQFCQCQCAEPVKTHVPKLCLITNSRVDPCLLTAGSTATGRLADMLQRLSPPAAADMLASMLTQSVSFKQQVLEAVDHNERLRLAVTLVQQVSGCNTLSVIAG